jgi:hypothetical protein
VPSFLNTVRSDARLAAVAPGRMPSSAVTTTCSAVRRSSAGGAWMGAVGKTQKERNVHVHVCVAACTHVRVFVQEYVSAVSVVEYRVG